MRLLWGVFHCLHPLAIDAYGQAPMLLKCGTIPTTKTIRRKVGPMAGTRAVVTVLGKDRTGIVARIATTLTDCGANIDDIQQNVLKDIFSMTMLVTLDEEHTKFNDVQERLTADGKDLGLQVIIQREDVFDFMYNV